MTVLITLGDPTGIGPEVVCKAFGAGRFAGQGLFTVIGPTAVLLRCSGHKKLFAQKNLSFVDIPINAKQVARLFQDPFARTSRLLAGRIAFATLEKAVALIKEGQGSALVTAPISKANVKLAGFGFAGHTEYLCAAFGVKAHAMMLFNKRLRVVLSTIHEPLKTVATQITSKLICEKLVLTTQVLKGAFGIKAPRIAVCGLNPHAGEEGMLGREEQEIIAPGMRWFLKTKESKNVKLTGPWPADTVFNKAVSGAFDAVLCQYHDQGLIPLKLTGFDSAVNMTLGLPFVRTSPGHGTAFDIAGRGIANPGSMIAALQACVGHKR